MSWQNVWHHGDYIDAAGVIVSGIAIFGAYYLGRRSTIGLQRRQIIKDCMEQNAKCIHLMQNLEFEASGANEESIESGDNKKFLLKRENAANEFIASVMILENIIRTLEFVTNKKHFNLLTIWLTEAKRLADIHNAENEVRGKEMASVTEILTSYQVEVTEVESTLSVDRNEAMRIVGKDRKDKFDAAYGDYERLTDMKEYGERQKPMISHFTDLYSELTNY